MKLTIIAPETVFEHEVDASMQVQDIVALIEAEAGLPASSFEMSSDAGVVLSNGAQTLESYGLKGNEATVFLTLKGESSTSPVASSSSAGQSSSLGLPASDADLERMRLQALGNTHLMAELRKNDPEMADAFEHGGQRFKDAYMAYQRNFRQLMAQRGEFEKSLNDDPYDVEAQKKIEDAIRMEAVEANLEHAMEYSPEAFGRVTMLYINVEVNGHPVKAFVDSGAQSTVISPECAEACGIMRLLDHRFQGLAMGVGTAKILGRVHSAQIKLGNLHLPCSFSVMEGASVELLFGLDMLKRHQCCIDLSTNTLRINTTEVPFLAEHELPASARQPAFKDGMPTTGPSGDAAGPSSQPSGGFPGAGNTLGGPAGAGPSGAAPRAQASVATAASPFPETDIQNLIGFGVTREQAIQLLEAAGGNVDVAASMVFG